MSEKITRRKEYQGFIKNAEGEIETVTLESKEYEASLDPFIPATPARITPSRRKPVNRPYKTLFVFSDLQAGYRRILDHKTGQHELIPLHDERAMYVARMIARVAMPDIIINNGDSVDLSSLSKYPKDSNHFMHELGPAFQRVHDYYAELKADNPNARLVEVSSNHNQRLARYVLDRVPELYDLRRPGEEDYPVNTYPYLINAKHLGLEWYGGYPAGQFVYGEEYGAPPVVFRHGTESSSNGTTASKIMKRYEATHNVHGHAHEAGYASHTTPEGIVLQTMVVGALCRTDGVVPSYWSSVDDNNRPVYRHENWQQSVAVITDHMNGEYTFENILIKDGRAYWRGGEYVAEPM